MGATISVVRGTGGSFGMNTGDTFLYTIQNPAAIDEKYMGNQGGSCSGSQSTRFKPFTINSSCETSKTSPPIIKHLIYEGVIKDVVPRGGKNYYSYELMKVWASPDPYKTNASGSVGPWSWEGNTPEYRKWFFGDKMTPADILKYTPKLPDFKANFGSSYSLIPQFIAEDDPNLGVAGEFNRLSQKDIVQFLNNYAINAGFTSELTSERVIKISKNYMGLKINEIQKEYQTNIENKILPIIKNSGAKYTLKYKRKTDGVLEIETLSPEQFLSRGPTTVIPTTKPGSPKYREFNGVEVDSGMDYEKMFKDDLEKIYNHRKRFINIGGDTAILRNIKMTGTVTKENITIIPLVDDIKDPLNTDQLLNSRSYSILLKEASKYPGTIAWTQHMTITESGARIVKTTFFSQEASDDRVAVKITEPPTYISGRIGERPPQNIVGSQTNKLTKYKSFGVELVRKPTRNEILTQMNDAREKTLGMLRAYIEKDYTEKGTRGALKQINTRESPARRMYLMSLLLKTNIEAIEKAMSARASIFRSAPAEIKEGFTSTERKQRDILKEKIYIDGLRSASDKNEDIADRIANASTLATTQMISFIVASGVFIALAAYPTLSGGE
jgi:hypothetical protein